MQLKKDVLIAGGVVAACVALVVVALVATGKKDAPSDPIVTAPLDTYGGSSTSYGDPMPLSGSSNPVSGVPIDSYGGFPPAPMAGDGGFGAAPGGTSAFAPSSTPLTPSGFDTTPMPGYSDPIGATPAPVAAATTTPGGTHTVAKGETLGDISATHYGTTKHWRKIVEANPGLDPARLKIGQVIQIPAVETAAAVPTATPGGADTYTVKKGESYYTIAKKMLGSSSRWREIERLNNVPAESLRVGTVITLPAKDAGGATGGAGSPGIGGGKTHVVAKGETLGDISKAYFGTTTKWKQIVEANPGVRPENLKVGQSLAIPDLPVAAAATAAPISGNSYTVKSGDTLESIAASTLGKKSAWKQIVEANPGLQPTALRIGQVLAIPGGSSAPAPLAPTTGAPGDAFAPLPGGAAPLPVAPPAPTFQDDPFYSPYDAQPASAPLR
jgi:nucleoid-associated protein YgaU